MKWEYGGAYLRHDMSGVIELPHGSLVQVADLLIEMPTFMKQADCLFIDPPWNTGNLRTFYTKAEIPWPEQEFSGFTKALFGRIDEIAPASLFLEIGEQFLPAYIRHVERRYRTVAIYSSTYFHKSSNRCCVLHGSHRKEKYPNLQGLDEEDIIAWICKNHPYRCIGDLCMGRGLVGRHAYLNGRRFVGTELNPRRLAVLVEFIRTRESGVHA